MSDVTGSGGGEAPQAPGRTAEEIQNWMVEYLARELDVSPDEIDVAAPFEHFALDSMKAIAMTGDLETWLGRSVDPTIVYDYPTIERLAGYLAGEAGRGGKP